MSAGGAEIEVSERQNRYTSRLLSKRCQQDYSWLVLKGEHAMVNPEELLTRMKNIPTLRHFLACTMDSESIRKGNEHAGSALTLQETGGSPQGRRGNTPYRIRRPSDRNSKCHSCRPEGRRIQLTPEHTRRDRGLSSWLGPGLPTTHTPPPPLTIAARAGIGWGPDLCYASTRISPLPGMARSPRYS